MFELNTIICPIDFFDTSRKAAECARVLAEKFDSKIIAVHVTTPLADYFNFTSDDGPPSKVGVKPEDDAGQDLKLFVEEHFVGLTVDAEVVKGDVDEEILQIVERFKGDLIVMGTNGRKGLDRMVFGSVAESIVKKSPVPVMTVRL